MITEHLHFRFLADLKTLLGFQHKSTIVLNAISQSKSLGRIIRRIYCEKTFLSVINTLLALLVVRFSILFGQPNIVNYLESFVEDPFQHVTLFPRRILTYFFGNDLQHIRSLQRKYSLQELPKW